MTKISLLVVILFSALTSEAQKVYATKTGQTAFNASSPIEKIAAVNNQTDSKFVADNGQVVFAVLIKGFKFENQASFHLSVFVYLSDMVYFFRWVFIV